MRWERIISALCPMIAAAIPARAAVTYYRDIAPILFESCAGCHRPGQPGPFALLTYEDARRHAGTIAEVTRRRYMPPWLPEPGYGEFQGERRLSEAQIRAIGEWARTGAPAGSPADAPPSPPVTPEWLLGPPDVVVQAAKSFALPPDGPDLFWNFILTPSISASRYVKAIEIRPGNARVHHANLLVDRERTARRQEKQPGEGFPGMDLAIETDTFDPDSHFLFWKPGGTPRVEPDGIAWRLDPGNDLVLNVHLQPSGNRETVRPAVGLYFTDKPPTVQPMLVKLEDDRSLDIPAGARDFLVSDDFRLPVDVDVLAVYPHAHYLGTLLEAFVTLPDGSRRWLIRIPHWDVNWQSVYPYRAPVFLPKGTLVSMRFHYDNSAANPCNPSLPPRRVTGGNQSTDEMGHFWIQLVAHGEGDQRPVVQEALMRHRLERHPDDVSSRLSLGALLLSRKQTEAAIAELREVLRVAPDNAQALNNYGAALQAEGRMDEAVEQFRRALRTQPDFTNARFNLGSALLAQGKVEEASAHLRELVAARPDDRAARERLTAALVRMGADAAAVGQDAAAAGLYRELVALDPSNADLRNNLGILLVKTGDLAGALAQFEAALKANPAHAPARRNLEQVRSKLGGR
jgi:tetratricopeptide (TPR) repeat protein/mono/diheme cytochrome c family protein